MLKDTEEERWDRFYPRIAPDGRSHISVVATALHDRFSRNALLQELEHIHTLSHRILQVVAPSSEIQPELILQVVPPTY